MKTSIVPTGLNQKTRIELWNLKVKGNDVPTYTKTFPELTLILPSLLLMKLRKIDKYIVGLPDNIYGMCSSPLGPRRQTDNKREGDDSTETTWSTNNIPLRAECRQGYNMRTGVKRRPYGGSLPSAPRSARPKTLDETIELANDLMDQKLRTYGERQSDNKMKADDSSRNNHGHQQQPFKRQNVAKVYNIGTGKRSRMGDLCPSALSAIFTTMARAPRSATSATREWECTRLVVEVGNAEKKKKKEKRGKKRGNASGNLDSNVVTGTFLLNNHYASILFDTGADRSFISTAFSSLIDIILTPLDNSYDVELVDGKIVGIDTIIQGCTLNFLDHPFHIDLMPIELGSFDVIIGMDWLRRCHAVIVCDEKLVQVPYGNETLTFCGNESSNERESRLAVISYSKAQEYMAKGCQVFLAQISTKKEEDKSEGKQIKDVPIIRDFPEVFPEDLPGLPPARPVEFQIDLIP
ncbi:putative reverse transcriptase domain-containing protein [Tanacetum coccineum]